MASTDPERQGDGYTPLHYCHTCRTLHARTLTPCPEPPEQIDPPELRDAEVIYEWGD